MTTKIPCIDVFLMPTVVVYVLSHYMAIVNHCRVYFGPFPLKYPKIGVRTPGFGPKMEFLHRKCANTIVSYTRALNVSNDTIFTVIINTLDRLSLVFWTKIMK